MRRPARIRVALVAAGLVLAAAVQGSASIAIRWGSAGVRVRFEASRFPLVFQLHDKSASGVSNVSAGSDPLAAFRAALASWQSIPTSTIRFADLALTGVESAAADDRVNLITMANTPANVTLVGGTADTGAVALTRLVFSVSSGRISEADIVFNPRTTFSTTLASDTFDLQAVATHELGHALGCDHSPTLNDTMYYLIGRQSFFPRYLSVDATGFASFTYPNGARADALGSITGEVTQAGKGVFGASVTAVDLDRNRVYTALTEPDGSYAITGPLQGRYTVYAEPLDGPMTSDTLLVSDKDAYYRGLNTSFRTVFRDDVRLGSGSSGSSSGSGGGKRGEVDLSIPGSTATLNITRVGRGDPNTGEGVLASRASVVHPGETVSLFVGGPDTWKLENVDDVRILGDGITIDRTKGVRALRDSKGVEIGTSVVARIDADAAPGPRTLRLKLGDQQAAATGAFVVAPRTPPTQTLYLPYLSATAERYTGIALANPSALPASLRILGRDDEGETLYEEDAIVPAEVTIAAGAQTARLERQFFNFSSTTRQSGSVTIESDNKSVAGFYLAGDLAGNFLDGAEAFTRAYRQLTFVDVLQNAGTSTEIHLANVKDVAVTVQLTLLGTSGGALASTVSRTIPARGKIGETVGSIFGFGGELAAAHVRASSSEEALVGFAYTRQRDAVFGTSAQPIESAAAVLYAPQLASGDLGVQYRTRLNVVNAGTSSAPLTVTVYSDAGAILAGPSNAGTIAPGGHLALDAAAFFGFSGPIQGWVKLASSSGARLLGSVTFGDGDPTRSSLRFGAALPLTAAGATSFLFSHVAQGSEFYTGVAFLALEASEVKVEVVREDGSSAGSRTLSIPAGGRSAALLESLVPASRGQTQGYVRVTATRPVIGFELFGAINGGFLSAVPPQAFSP